MKETKYNFEKLTLKDDVDIDVYEEAFNYVFESSDICNVAITGAYGAGKSSILASYKKKHPEKQYLHISLAHFNSENNDAETGNTVSESVLEGKILNQLIHQISSTNIPQTKFKVKHNIKAKDIVWCSILCFTLLVCVGYLCLFGEWRSFVGLFSGSWLGNILHLTLSKYTRLIAGLVILAISYAFIHYAIKLQKNKNIFKRLSVQGNEIEIFENQDDSFFDKYLNEVLYLFENSKTDVIVFEDMDRFEMNHIFERLREVNTLANIQLAKHKHNQKLRFFYLLRDDVFDSKDRTKFFDYIIPVVPVVDGTNSYDQFIDHLDKNKLTEKFDKEFLQGISLYIDDMRLLKNICNEFLIYYHRLNTTELNFNKMFAIITYKNLFPKDFSDLQNGRGYVKGIFDHKDDFISTEEERLSSLIVSKKGEIEACNKEHLTDKWELDVIKESKQKEFDRSPYYYQAETRKKWTEWKEEIYPIRLAAIENKKDGRISVLEKELAGLELQLAKLKSRPLKDIVNRDNMQIIFHTPTVNEIGEKNEYTEIRGSDYFALLKYLISEGYIDETYADYMTYFYPNSLSVTDKKFLRSVRDKQGKAYAYTLKNIPLVLSYLNISDFEEIEILNYDLFEYVLSNNNDYSERFINQLKERRNFDFLSQYFSMRNISDCINKIVKLWPEFFKDVIVDKSMPSSQIREISSCILLYCDNETIESANIDGCLTKYVSETSDYLNLDKVDTEHLANSFELINVRFKSIDYNVSEKELFKLVYERCLYCLTFENIKLMLKYIHGIDDVNVVKHKNYTSLLSIADAPIYGYVQANIADYFRIIFAVCDERIEDDESTIVSVLNDDSIPESIKTEYITLQTTCVADISKITNKKMWSKLLEESKLSFSESNLFYCFTHYKSLTKLLVGYINQFKGTINMSRVKDEDFIDKFFDATIRCFDLTDEKYGQILSSSNLVYRDTFELKNIPVSKMDVLINKKIICMSKGCLSAIRNNYNEVLYSFINRNIEDYVEIMTAELFRIDELMEILEWEIDDDLKISLLEYTSEKISIVDKPYSEKIMASLLKKHFVKNDLPFILRKYVSYSDSIKQIILDLSNAHFPKVRECVDQLTVDFRNDFFSCDRIDVSFKEDLFIDLIPKISVEEAKALAVSFKREDLSLVLEPNRRPKIPFNSKNKVILEQFKKKRWISDYTANEDNTYYTVKRNKQVANRTLPTECL